MDLYAAIDLRAGRCVRLVEGDFGRETVYGADPVKRARAFAGAGVPWLHVVDLDAARTGAPVNRPLVAAIAAAVDVPVQSGGGVRSEDDAAELFATGVERVVMGTAAVNDPALLSRLAARWPGRVAAGIDHRDGEVKVKGWLQGTGRDAVSVVAELEAAGAAAIVVTEISRDGLMVGPDTAGYKSLLGACQVPLIASGGVGSLDDLRRLARARNGDRRLAGAIVGRAIYEGRFTVADAVAASRGAPR
jgi:phosphoribosylformimino-5-aminoimidazole carboxamide ribotide isomerase